MEERGAKVAPLTPNPTFTPTPPQAGGAARVARRACRPPRGPCGLRGGSLGQHVVPRPACHELARLEDGRLASEARRGISPGASQRRDAPWSGRVCRRSARVCCALGWVSRARGGGGPPRACGARAGYERLAARQQRVSVCLFASPHGVVCSGPCVHSVFFRAWFAAVWHHCTQHCINLCPASRLECRLLSPSSRCNTLRVVRSGIDTGTAHGNLLERGSPRPLTSAGVVWRRPRS